MRLAWFTPFVKESAIGQVGRDVCEELAKTNDVDIWTPHKENLIQTSLKVVSFGATTPINSLDKYDYVIYNMGNFAGFHRDIFDMLQRKKGIVILHDQSMSGFWGQYHTFAEYGGDPINGYESYFASFRKFYGKSAEAEARKAHKDGIYPIYNYDGISRFDFISAIIENAMGVFTHAAFFAERIKSFSNVPVGYSYLPCSPIAKPKGDMGEVGEIIETAKRQGKKIIVSNGIVHPVKQIDKIADLLVKNKLLREKMCYVVVGSYGGDYGEKLAQMASGELEGCLYMLGYRSAEEMNYAIASADICANLRYPNSEVCSLSLLEQMSSGNPTLVINSGVYGEMPDNSVIKLDYAKLDNQLEDFLVRFVRSSSEYRQYGKNALEFVRENATSEAYASELSKFIADIDADCQVVRIQNNFIDSQSALLDSLGFSRENAEMAVMNIANKIELLFNSNIGEAHGEPKTIGIWAAFQYEIPNLNREGISRFMKFMISAYMRRYDVVLEIWTYSFNEAEINKIFDDLTGDPSVAKRVKVVTEKNWVEHFNPRTDAIERVGAIDSGRDNLSSAAFECSEADIMIPMIVYLDNVVKTGKQIHVPAHDMAVADKYDDFIKKDGNNKFRCSDILERAKNMAASGAVFFSNCKTVQENQILKYVTNLQREKSKVVYLPINIPKGIKSKTLSEQEVRDKFDIKGRYLFYPTQVRPYKNIQVLVKALALLKDEYKDLKLVMTGNPEDLPEVEQLIKESGLDGRIVRVNSVSETELYSIYKYAAVTPVTSTFEGGFPWQACEALYMGVPVVMSDIDVTAERIEVCGFTKTSSGLLLFNPKNANELAKKLKEVLRDRQSAVARQKKFADKLFSYDWDKAAELYHEIFSGA